MAHFTRILRLGTKKTYRGRHMSVYCKVEYTEDANPRLSITGVEGPTHGGNCMGGCGQIDTDLRAQGLDTFAPGWNAALLKKFLDVWERWHLNDLRAGTPHQTRLLREEFYPKVKYPENDYTHACAFLAKHGYLTDAHPVDGTPYKYGSAWLYETVPDGVLEFLMGLPRMDREPAWV